MVRVSLATPPPGGCPPPPAAGGPPPGNPPLGEQGNGGVWGGGGAALATPPRCRYRHPVSLATPLWITRLWITRIAVCHGACGAALIGRNSMGTGAETDTGWVSYDQPLSGRRRCSRGV